MKVELPDKVIPELELEVGDIIVNSMGEPYMFMRVGAFFILKSLTGDSAYYLQDRYTSLDDIVSRIKRDYPRYSFTHYPKRDYKLVLQKI